MCACAVLTKKSQTRKPKKEPTLVLRSVPNGEIPRLFEGPPSYDKCISPTDGLPNGLNSKNRPNGTKTTVHVKALVHHDSSDNEEKETVAKEKTVIEKPKAVPNGHVSSIVGANLPGHAEVVHENESFDIHGDRTCRKDADVNDNYLKHEKQIEDELETSQNDIRNYVLAEQAKGLQYKTSCCKRPPYATSIYGGGEKVEDDMFDEPKMHYLKVSDHEDSLSGIDISENELEKSYEADEEMSLPGTLERHIRERSPIVAEIVIPEDEVETKQDSKSYLETLADILLTEQGDNVAQEEKVVLKTANGEDIVAFFEDSPNDIRNMIAHYLKKRKLSCVLLSPSNFHYVMHASDSLELKQLTSHCYEFLDENPQFDQRSLVMSCVPCQKKIATRNDENVKVMKGTATLRPSPHFCVAFSRQEAQRTNIDVIDINTGCEIYARETKRPFLCERGFSCCGVHYSDCPYIFVSGGKQKHSKHVWRYDVIVSEWKKMPYMIHGRSYHSMVAFNDCAIYVIGGAEVDCIEEFNLDNKKWTECTRLNFPVESSTCAVYEKKIYIFGDSGSVAGVQCFTPSSNNLETLHPLPCPVGEGHAVVFRDKVFIVTGRGQIVCFEPVTGLSYLGACQPVIRSKFCLYVFNDKIYITGGRLEEESPEKESEYNYRYNMSTDAWTRTRKLPRRFPVRTFCDVHIQRRCPVVPFDKMKL